MHVTACKGVWTLQESLHRNLTLGEKSLSAMRNRPCISFLPVWRSTNRAISPPYFSPHSSCNRKRHVSQTVTFTCDFISWIVSCPEKMSTIDWRWHFKQVLPIFVCVCTVWNYRTTSLQGQLMNQLWIILSAGLSRRCAAHFITHPVCLWEKH